MIIVGIVSYRKASQGMSERFVEATRSTLNMATEYVEMSNSFVESEAMGYAFDANLRNYFAGLYGSDWVTMRKIIANTRNGMISTKVVNPFINEIHVITNQGIQIMTTKGARSVDGFFEDYRKEMSAELGYLEKWADSHPLLDEKLDLEPSEYILACQTVSQSNNACVVVDISAERVQEFLDTLELGTGSIAGFVTRGGRELVAYHGMEEPEGEGQPVFYGREFFDPEQMSSQGSGSGIVSYQGERYLFVYSRSDINNAVFCVLVPMRHVTGQAETIKNITLLMVLLAAGAAGLIGIWISMGIQGNMKRLSGRLGQVAEGNLTVRVTASGRDEFQGLAGITNAMIESTKKLVMKVNGATGQLERSALEVSEASGALNDYSRDITLAIDEINRGMSRQAEHAQECVERTGALSEDMNEVNRVLKKVEALVKQAEDSIGKGMELIRRLGESTKETTAITARVGESIEQLNKESAVINTFVDTITDITEQTNLLSLNASIEAARAGEAGRGFAVVAEEIRKLADDSARAAGKIGSNVESIGARTRESVSSAKQAEAMVELQSAAVGEVIKIFHGMSEQMQALVAGLQEIVQSMGKADREKGEALEAVEGISAIIEETAANAELVREVAGRLLENVDKMDQTSKALGENMEGLKKEISLFKTE